MGNTCCNNEEQKNMTESNCRPTFAEGKNSLIVEKILEEQYANGDGQNSPDKLTVQNKNFNESQNNILDQQSETKSKQPDGIQVNKEYVAEDANNNGKAKKNNRKGYELPETEDEECEILPTRSEENSEHYNSKLNAVKAHYEADKEKLTKL